MTQRLPDQLVFIVIGVWRAHPYNNGRRTIHVRPLTHAGIAPDKVALLLGSLCGTRDWGKPGVCSQGVIGGAEHQTGAVVPAHLLRCSSPVAGLGPWRRLGTDGRRQRDGFLPRVAGSVVRHESWHIGASWFSPLRAGNTHLWQLIWFGQVWADTGGRRPSR